MSSSAKRPLRLISTVTAALAATLAAAAPAEANPSFTTFESGQVRPLALSPDGRVLFAVNTPDNRLEVFRVTSNGLRLRASIPVGLEPVSVAARSDTEVWVVNHLSDSISVVEISPRAFSGRVTRTLYVGDEPRDIVFAGTDRSRAFITTAHRGQNAPYDPQLTTPGVGRADVWVFDANNLGAASGGTPLNIINLFTDTPRALAVTPDGSKVYAAGFHSGNQTTILHELIVPDGGENAGGLPAPNQNFAGASAPEVGLIVKYIGGHWVDELGRIWDNEVKLSLPDKDVFAINATANPPALVPGAGGFFTGVGTILFNMAVNPVSGKVYVSNTEAFNEVRFEGPGVFGNSTVRGHIAESRITVLDSTGVHPRHLNKHINYTNDTFPANNPENAKSLAFPQEMVVSSDGTKLYVAALGSSKIGVFNTAQLENNTFVPSASDHINLTGGGPTGIVLDEAHGRLYALTRFDNSISVVDTATKAEIDHLAMYNPEPAHVVAGRKFLYDARLSSSRGDSACASCHIYGDFDSLAWDLGNPDGDVSNDTNPTLMPPGMTATFQFHPMKGPMTTQSLRGMANHGTMHWRGDRTGAVTPGSAQPDTGAFNEKNGFLAFNGAFVGLLGRHAELSSTEMNAFADFILDVVYPPNPIRHLDDSLTPDQQAGFDFYFGQPSFFQHNRNCNDCHTLDREANEGYTARPGFFGTDGMSSFVFESQVFKTPHIRNMYQKVGMFGIGPIFITPTMNSGVHMGDQVRGFGFTHDGGFDTLFRFFSTILFAEEPNANPTGIPYTSSGDLLRRQIEDYMMVFDSNLKPIVGQQVTLTWNNGASANPRINLLIARANAGDCDLVAKSHGLREESGYLYVGNGLFTGNRVNELAYTDAGLRLLANTRGNEITYTCVPPGSGARIAIDRDGDGHRDGDEEDAGTSPSKKPNTL
ncbi:MAG TPA: hypothetical protein VE093_34050 [Polyangiaceae bacterium]|jgi:DNA-binding beta-propeller fold protein YncE|nr:hypothetical protein [Polyangiaceae bacterium]